MTDRITPVEHCGNLMPASVSPPRSECVLRPGHSGSHADDRGARWWYDAEGIDWQKRTEQAEELLRIAHETSNKSETERAHAVQRADQAEERLAHLQTTSEAAGRTLARESDRASQTEQRLLDMTLNRDQLQATLNRIRALAADLERGSWTGPAIARRIHEALNQP